MTSAVFSACAPSLYLSAQVWEGKGRRGEGGKGERKGKRVAPPDPSILILKTFPPQVDLKSISAMLKKFPCKY